MSSGGERRRGIISAGARTFSVRESQEGETEQDFSKYFCRLYNFILRNDFQFSLLVYFVPKKII